MSEFALIPHPDTVDFSIFAEETVTNNTIKVKATIVAVIPTTTEEEQLRREITAMLTKFIRGASWHFSDTQRKRHESGVEELWLTATTRVSENEHRGLERRAEEASLPDQGMRIRDVSVALEHLDDVNKVLGGGYRMGKVQFSGAASMEASNRGSRHAYASGNFIAASSAAVMHDSDDDALGNTMKLTMSASVQYRKNSPSV